MISADILRRLSALRLSRAAYTEVLAIIAEVLGPTEERRAKDRARKFHGNSTEIPPRKGSGNSTEIPDANPSPDKERSPTPPKEINPSPPLATLAVVSAREADFRAEFDRQFWPGYPHKVGKPAAFKAFCRARKTAPLATILFGLDRYVAEKPGDRPWLNPATFLNQERFNDQPAESDTARRNGRPEPAQDALLRAVADQFAPRNGPPRNDADPDDRLRDQPRRARGHQEPTLDLGPSDYQRRE